MSVTQLAQPRLYFKAYPDHRVPPWLLARIKFGRDEVTADLEFREGISPLEQLRAIAWAGDVLPHYLRLDGRGYAINDNSVVPVLPVSDVDAGPALAA